MIYYGIFSSILMYGSQIWGQHDRIVEKLQILQNKALRIMNFSPRRTSATPFFKSNEILKLADNITLQNFLYAHDCLRKNLPSSLIDERLTLVNVVDKNTKGKRLNQLEKIRTDTILYGSKSIKSKSVDAWNLINELFYQKKLQEKSKLFCKKFVTQYLVDNY